MTNVYHNNPPKGICKDCYYYINRNKAVWMPKKCWWFCWKRLPKLILKRIAKANEKNK